MHGNFLCTFVEHAWRPARRSRRTPDRSRSLSASAGFRYGPSHDSARHSPINIGKRRSRCHRKICRNSALFWGFGTTGQAFRSQTAESDAGIDCPSRRKHSSETAQTLGRINLGICDLLSLMATWRRVPAPGANNLGISVIGFKEWDEPTLERPPSLCLSPDRRGPRDDIPALLA